MGENGKGKPVKPSKKRGQPSAWDKTIKPHLSEIEQWRSEGATIDQIAKNLGITATTIYETQNKHPEFAEALTRAKERRAETLEGVLWKLALGKAKRVEVIKRVNPKTGELEVVGEREITVENQGQYALSMLKQHHGWSDNPKVDEATAKALDDKELREFVNKTLRVSDDADDS